MGVLSNPYVLLAAVAVAAGYALTEKVKKPVKAVPGKLKAAGKKAGKVGLKIVTLGRK